ncbi:DUF302 domain-containing protein [Prosthecomicrobium sp. N25]|uniref:DUF302 domain-containing protein n=1 Tax=Prosthecomicrobium sp. N25 TaxID=3129254 RepID=UPI003076EEA6
MITSLKKQAEALLLAATLFTSAAASADEPGPTGVVRVRSAYPPAETVERIRQDVAAKGIRFFAAIDQGQIVNEAGIGIGPSTLLIFGNPPLGGQFLKANPDSGLDWPVRLLVRQDPDGTVWAVYTDFGWIARRYGITDLDPQFAMASAVIGSITASVAGR